MPDITMCSNKDCSKKETCYRFKAKPNEYRQSYFSDMKEENCKLYWKMDPPTKNAEKKDAISN